MLRCSYFERSLQAHWDRYRQASHLLVVFHANPFTNMVKIYITKLVRKWELACVTIFVQVVIYGEAR